MDWKKMPEGKEKYAAYLCSREWSVLKESVKERSRGVCERCTLNKMDHVHHLTYSRKYAEVLGDLQACCRECHDFIHGKSDYDPAEYRPVTIPWCGRKVKTFYLAGKITGTQWRDEIVSGWSDARSEAYSDAIQDGLWLCVRSGATACGISLDYCGPWWMDMCGGHGTSIHNTGPHAYGDHAAMPDEYSVRKYAENRKQVSRNVHCSIRDSDMVFAWIDSSDCYGTIFEIGLARAQNKVVVVGIDTAFSQQAADMWLAFEGCYCVYGASAREAWDEFWDLVAFEDKPTLCVGAKADGGPLAVALYESVLQAESSEAECLLDSLEAVLILTSRGTVPLAQAVPTSSQEAKDGTHTQP